METNKDFSENFIKNLLLNLEHSDYDQYMELSYHVLIQSPSVILKMDDPINNKIASLDRMIKYFESIEAYEKCTNLQKLKYMLYAKDSL